MTSGCVTPTPAKKLQPLSKIKCENYVLIKLPYIYILLPYKVPQLYMVTILRRRQEERKYCPCKQLVCGKLIRKRRPFNSLYFLCPFGWVEENRALFLVLQLLEKTSQACMASRSLGERWVVLIQRNQPSKRGRAFVGNGLIGVWRRSKKVACDWLFFIQSLGT